MKSTETTPKGRKSHTPIDPGHRLQLLVSMAYDTIEERIKNGTVTGSELVELLRQGSREKELKEQILESQNELMKAKTDSLRQQQNISELVATAIRKMTRYSGNFSEEEDDE